MKYDRISRKYHLRWDDASKTIRILVHEDCLRSARIVPHTSPWVGNMRKEHGLDELFDSFSGNISGETFGFNHVLKKVNGPKGYSEFCLSLPKIRIRTTIACEECAGTGICVEEGCERDTCLHCDGEKVKYAKDWKSAWATTASLSLFFLILDGEVDTCAEESQHVTLTMCATQGQHGSSMCGCFGCDMLDYLSSNPPELAIINSNTTSAMEAAYREMWGKAPFAHTTRTGIYPESVGLTVHGDACGVNTGFYNRNKGEGRDFDSHNVDSPLQSISLFAGIASLVDQVDILISRHKGELVPA